MQVAGLSGSGPELFGAKERVGLPEHRPFPFAGLAGVVLPGDLGVVWRVVTAIGNVVLHWISNVLDQATVDCQTQQGGEVTLSNAIGGIDACRVSKLRYDVSPAQN